MLSKKKAGLDQQAISTILSEGCVLSGDFKAPGVARIDGQVIGDVSVDEGLILGEKGNIKGNVITKQLIVYGTVDGNINVQSLEIRATGKITGDINTTDLQIESGAVYNGSLNMKKGE